MQPISRLFTISVAAAVLLVADTQKSTIKVEVKNQFDKPVENASVILDFLGSHQITKLGKRKGVHWEVHTNQQGLASFPPVPYGTIQLQVITKKYQTFGEKFEVDSDQKKFDIKLNPPQSQYSAHPPLKPADPDKKK
jgi:hypothetical protein